MATTENVSLAWKRPSGPPRVWKRFEINEKTGSEGKDGKVLRFSIEEIPSDRYDEVVELMVNYFLADEPLCCCLNIKNDPDAIEDHRRAWRHYLRQGISVALFLDDPDVDKREIVGANVLLVRTREDKISCNELKLKSARVTKIKEFIKDVRAGTSGLDRYKVDKCLFAFGLLVIPRFRGYSLGGRLLAIRNVIGREYKIPVTESVFTSPGSQILAMRNGFEVLVKKKYSKAYDSKGKLLFSNVRAKDVKIMGKRLY